MDNSRIVFLINDQVRAVKAKYEDSGAAEMFKTFDATIQVGDLAVVQSTTRHMMTVVKVTEIDVDVNRLAMLDYAMFLHNEAPCGCFGSPEHVKDWIAQGGLAGLLA